ncbi:hypothetical protein Q9R29_02755 [Rothia sp. ARF10]|nr:hypothetical protein [Rothia sp. ARF10]
MTVRPARSAVACVTSLAAVLVTVVLLTVILGGCGSGGDGPGSGGRPAYEMSVDCPDASGIGSVKPTVEQLNSVLARADLPYWQAADIGASARLTDGRLVWVFGDTMRRQGVAPGMVANSMLVSSGLCVSQVMATARGPVIPDVEPGVVRWPMSVSVVRDGDEDVVIVFTGRIRRGSGTDVWGFRYLGSDAVTFRVRAGEAPQLDTVLPLTPDDESAHQVNWGSASMVSGDHIYVYGTELPSGAAFGRSLLVGRGRLGRPEDRQSWEFWDGRRWQADPHRASPVIAAEGGVSQTLSVDHIGDEFVAVSKRDGDLGSTVATWTSASPVGPWRVSDALEAPFLTGRDEFAYAPLAHPEITLADGGLLVSISRNTTDLARLRQDPTVGRPRFAEIPRP